MEQQYGNDNYYTNGYQENMYQDSGYQTGFEGGFEGGFESGDTVVHSLHDFKSLVCEEVIAKSFLFMLAALVITAVASLTVSPYTAIMLLTGNNYWLLLGGELAIVLVSNWAVRKNKPILCGILFTVYSYLTGVICSVLFLLFTASSIATIFFVTAGVFGIMAVYGLVTKKDLSSMGSILLMGLLGIVLVSLVNIIFLHSSMVDIVIDAIGVLIFVGLTAYDTQKIKRMVSMSGSENVLALSLYGAFELYLDFINLFLRLLSLFGKKK